jgi:hypothetical protein
MAGMRVERLDHLGIVAGVCQEIGLAAYLDALAGPSQQQVSVGTAALTTSSTPVPHRSMPRLIPIFIPSAAAQRHLGLFGKHTSGQVEDATIAQAEQATRDRPRTSSVWYDVSAGAHLCAP